MTSCSQLSTDSSICFSILIPTMWCPDLFQNESNRESQLCSTNLASFLTPLTVPSFPGMPCEIFLTSLWLVVTFGTWQLLSLARLLTFPQVLLLQHLIFPTFRQTADVAAVGTWCERLSLVVQHY